MWEMKEKVREYSAGKLANWLEDFIGNLTSDMVELLDEMADKNMTGRIFLDLSFNELTNHYNIECSQEGWKILFGVIKTLKVCFRINNHSRKFSNSGRDRENNCKEFGNTRCVSTR